MIRNPSTDFVIRKTSFPPWYLVLIPTCWECQVISAFWSTFWVCTNMRKPDFISSYCRILSWFICPIQGLRTTVWTQEYSLERQPFHSPLLFWTKPPMGSWDTPCKEQRKSSPHYQCPYHVTLEHQNVYLSVSRTDNPGKDKTIHQLLWVTTMSQVFSWGLGFVTVFKTGTTASSSVEQATSTMKTHSAGMTCQRLIMNFHSWIFSTSFASRGTLPQSAGVSFPLMYNQTIRPLVSKFGLHWDLLRRFKIQRCSACWGFVVIGLRCDMGKAMFLSSLMSLVSNPN